MKQKENKEELPLTEFYSLQFSDDDENEGWFVEPVSEEQENETLVRIYASKYPFPIALKEEEAKEILEDMKEENPETGDFKIVKVSMQIEQIS